MKNIMFSLLIAFVPASVVAQEVSKPNFVVGDWCEYSVDALQRGQERQEIVAVQPDGGYTLKVTGVANDNLRIYNGANELMQTGDRTFVPARKSLVFPLQVGNRTGGGSYSFPHPNKPGVTVDAKTEIKAVERVNVTVPAGAFDTLRVELVTNYRITTGYSNQWVETNWLSLDPTVKFPVKLEFNDYGNRDYRFTRTLVKCGVAPK